ncbi:zinc-binding dehydrogenase [Streptomyces sp. NBC_00726]|uniref:zinc-binding dehydrogenase n=1 Tax=Streptomyces sp. NBC_00726 TaxID=2903674 RepID=UPI003862E9E9
MPKAYVFTRNGGPEAEVLTDPERPKPGPGELLVAAHKPAALSFTGVATPYDGLRRPGPGRVRKVPSGPRRLARTPAAPAEIPSTSSTRDCGRHAENSGIRLTPPGPPSGRTTRMAGQALGGAPVRRARTAAVLDEVARLTVDGVLRTHVTRTVPLGRAAEGLRAVEDGHALGKTVIEVTA